MYVSNYVALYLLCVHGSSLDDFQQALTAPQAQLERVEISKVLGIVTMVYQC